MHIDTPKITSSPTPKIPKQHAHSEDSLIFDTANHVQKSPLTEVSKGMLFPLITIRYNSQLPREKEINIGRKLQPIVLQNLIVFPSSQRNGRNDKSGPSLFNRFIISANVSCFRGIVTIRSPLLRNKKFLGLQDDESPTVFIENLYDFTLDLRKPYENSQAEAKWRINAKNLAVSLLRYKELYNALQKKRMTLRRKKRSTGSKSEVRDKILKSKSVSSDDVLLYSSVSIESAKNSPSMVKAVEKTSVGRLLQGQMLHGPQTAATLCMVGSNVSVAADSAEIEK